MKVNINRVFYNNLLGLNCSHDSFGMLERNCTLLYSYILWFLLIEIEVATQVESHGLNIERDAAEVFSAAIEINIFL